MRRDHRLRTTITRPQRRYDHRLGELARETGDIDHALRQGVPRSTARGRLEPPASEVVTVDVFERASHDLEREVIVLRRRIEQLSALLRLRIELRVLGLSASRYHSWRREETCDLDDVDWCPRSSPGQLTRGEVATIEEMVTSEEYRHVPTGTLALLGQRRRVHPQQPKVGIGATRPNEIWHVDTTLIRLLDGTRVIRSG